MGAAYILWEKDLKSSEAETLYCVSYKQCET